MNILIGIFWIIIGMLIILIINLILQLYRTVKEVTEAGAENKLYCPHCGTNDTSQITKIIIIMQLPGRAVDCACFYCNSCSKRWFMELDTLKQKELFPIGTYT